MFKLILVVVDALMAVVHVDIKLWVSGHVLLTALSGIPRVWASSTYDIIDMHLRR